MLRTKLFPETPSRDNHLRQSAVEKKEVAWGSDHPADNERETARVEARLVASIEIEAGAYIGFTENLSPTGVFVATDALGKVGGMVQLLIALPDLALVRAEGSVRWLRPASEKAGQPRGMGIRFERLSALDAVRIHEFTRTRLSGLFGDADDAHLRSA